jgi:hypothetical protein
MRFGKNIRSKKNIRKLRKMISRKKLSGGFIRGGIDQFATSSGVQTNNSEIFSKCNYDLKCN